MQIKIWIRPGEDGRPTIRLDYKYESEDTPTIQHFGNSLMNAVESGGEKNKKGGAQP